MHVSHHYNTVCLFMVTELCKAGKWYNEIGSCEDCQVGTYMDARSLNSTCKLCPERMTTDRPGADSLDKCICEYHHLSCLTFFNILSCLNILHVYTEVICFSAFFDGWMTCNFTSFSTVFQSYQEDGRLIMKNCVQWSSVYD